MDTRTFIRLGAALLDDAPVEARLASYLGAVRRLLEDISIPDAIGSVFDDRDATQFLVAASTGDVHVGFVAPNDPDAMSRAARAVGFAFNQRSFPSTIIARELGERIGRRRVPTQVFKAYLKPSGGAPRAVEAFLPEAEPDVVRGWIEEGVGTHIGFGLGGAAAVLRAMDIAIAAGFVLPAFMDGRPLTNPAEDLTAFYADGPTPAGRVRIEFFHAGQPPA